MQQQGLGFGNHTANVPYIREIELNGLVLHQFHHVFMGAQGAGMVNIQLDPAIGFFRKAFGELQGDGIHEAAGQLFVRKLPVIFGSAGRRHRRAERKTKHRQKSTQTSQFPHTFLL